MIGDQADMLPAQRSKFLGLENVKAYLHAGRAT
jgi:hypothetical protein